MRQVVDPLGRAGRAVAAGPVRDELVLGAEADEVTTEHVLPALDRGRLAVNRQDERAVLGHEIGVVTPVAKGEGAGGRALVPVPGQAPGEVRHELLAVAARSVGGHPGNGDDLPSHGSQPRAYPQNAMLEPALVVDALVHAKGVAPSG